MDLVCVCVLGVIFQIQVYLFVVFHTLTAVITGDVILLDDSSASGRFVFANHSNVCDGVDIC